MPDTYEPDKRPLREVVSSSTELSVPTYQRPYSWEVENVDDFWNDFVSNDIDDYFVGTIILARIGAGTDPSRSHRYEIIDGQQRIATFSILVRALIDSAKNNTQVSKKFAKDYFDGLHSSLVANSGDASRYSKYKLNLSELDRDFFEKRIQRIEESARRPGLRKSNVLIRKSYEHFLDKITEHLDESDAEAEDVYRKLEELLGKMAVICIESTSIGHAYSIFATINSKKVDLQPIDLIKNYAFSVAHLAPGTEKSVQQQWTDMLSDLADKRVDASTFLRHYWNSYFHSSNNEERLNEKKISDKKLYRALTTEFPESKPEIMAELTEKLSDEYQNYINIAVPDKDSPADGPMRDLLEVGGRQAFPLLLSAKAAGIPRRAYDNLAKSLLIVYLRRGVSGRNPNELEDVFVYCAKKLRDRGVEELSVIYEELTAPGLMVGDRAFKEALVSEPLKPTHAKFILKKYAVKMYRRESELILNRRITLEHILPQSPDDLADWGISEDEHISNFERLGNLTLLNRPSNSGASNRKYEEKKDYLRNHSDLSITKSIPDDYSTWTLDSINDRGSKIADYAVNTWPERLVR